jgi:glycosyltransferase involved in cell wall biosynthesis
MKRLIIQQDIMTNYRIDLFNYLSKNYDLTIIHSGPKVSGKLVFFKQIIRKCFKIGPFYYQNIYNIINKNDILITEANLRYIVVNLILAFFPRNFKWISWGIGVSASYKKKYDLDNKYDFLRYLIFGKSDGLLFYSKYPQKKYISAGINKSKLFVAHNTFPNICEFKKKRKHFVFIGSLVLGKGLLSLLNEYHHALRLFSSKFPPLLIIGEGKMKNELKFFIKQKKLENKIKLLGPIFDKKKLNNIIGKSYFSISPNQAGLAVLHSMSCGVCFVTLKDSITGGEIFNINNKNGILLNNIKEIRGIFKDAYLNPKKYIQMGKNAHIYYYTNRTVSKMAKGFLDVIKFVKKF